jgi:hypothetical protein
MTDAAFDEQRDEQVAEAIVSGRSLRAVRKKFGLNQAEIDSVLERLWPVDTEARIRMIKRDVGKLDRLTQVFYEKALAGDVQSGLLTVRIWERLHELLGLDAVRRIDLQIINPPQEVPRHEKIRQAIMRLTEQAPPARRAVIERIDQLGPEKALEMLGSPQPNGGDGAVDAPAVPDATNGGSSDPQ